VPLTATPHIAILTRNSVPTPAHAPVDAPVDAPDHADTMSGVAC
jgi:hypothetical protein